MVFKKSNMREINDEMQRIIDQAQELIDATSGEVDDKVKSARVALMKGLNSAKRESDWLYEKALDKAQVADEYIHSNPYYAVGGVFFAGLLMGWMMSKR